jgi:hypothetical protein
MRRAGGYRSGMRYYEDWECMARIALLGAKLAPTPFVGAYYRRHAASTLAKADDAAVAKGHVVVMQTLCAGLLERPELLERHGEQLFWCVWTALRRSRRLGLRWREFTTLAADMDRLVRSGPQSVRRSRFAQAVRLVGFRWAERLQAVLLCRSNSIPATAERRLTRRTEEVTAA